MPVRQLYVKISLREFSLYSMLLSTVDTSVSVGEPGPS
jgi:hypothetical protein